MRTFFLLALCYGSVDAFLRQTSWAVVTAVVPRQQGVVFVESNTFATTSFDAFGQLSAKKIKLTDTDENSNDEALNLLRWISPLNPYMWFIYGFLFIYGVDFYKNL